MASLQMSFLTRLQNELSNDEEIDLEVVFSKIEDLQNSGISEDEQEILEDVKGLYNERLNKYLLDLKNNIQMLLTQMELAAKDVNANQQTDPEKLKSETLVGIQKLEAISPNNPDLANFITRFRNIEPVLDIMTRFSQDETDIRAKLKLADELDQEHAPGGEIMKVLRQAEDVAVSLEKWVNEQPGAIPSLQIQSKKWVRDAKQARTLSGKKYEEPVTMAGEVAQMTNLIIDWQREMVAHPENRNHTVEFYIDWNNDMVVPKPKHEAIDIARLRLQRKLWKEKIDEYIAESRSILDDPKADPRHALEALNRISSLPGLDNPEINLKIFPDHNIQIQKQRSPVDRAATLRKDLVANCNSLRHEKDVVQKAATLILAEKGWKEELDLRFPNRSSEEEILEPKELTKARQHVIESAQNEFIKELNQAERNFKLGAWQPVQAGLERIQQILNLRIFPLEPKDQDTLSSLQNQYSAIKSALEKIDLAGEDFQAKKTALDSLANHLPLGMEMVRQWEQFRILESRIQAQADASGLLMRMEKYAQAGSSIENLDELIKTCEGIDISLQPDERARLENAKQGLLAWRALRAAERARSPSRALHMLERALQHPHTAKVAGELKTTLERSLAPENEVQTALTRISEYKSKREREKAYDLAVLWAQKESRFQRRFCKEAEAIKTDWEKVVKEDLDKIIKNQDGAGINDNYPYTRVRSLVKSLAHMESTHHPEYLAKTEQKCAEAEAHFKLRNAPPRGSTPWSEVKSACQQAYFLADKYQNQEQMSFWQKQYNFAMKTDAFQSIQNKSLEDKLDELAALNDRLYGADPEVWFEISQAHFNLGKSHLE